MENEKIILTDLLEACLDFKREPTPKNEAIIRSITDRFIIKEYIPLPEKIVQVSLILGNITSDTLDQFEAESWLVIGKVVYGVLGYVANLENNLDKLSMSTQVVDLLYEMGVIDEVLKHCEKDYRRLDKMVDESLNFTNIFRILETTRLFSKDNIDDFVKEIHSFKTDLTPEMLENLKSIANASSPEFQAFKETMIDEVLGRAMDVDLNSLKPEPEEESKEEQKKDEEEEPASNA